MLEHKHLIVRAEVNKPPLDFEYMKAWLSELIDELDMKIMCGPFGGYSPVVGNRGLTIGAVIETSHVVLHAWDEEHPYMLQLDVYSCSDIDPHIVFDAIEEFEIEHLDYKFLDRKSKFIEIL